MNNSFREWFVFTRKERTGIVFLVIMVISFTCLPWFFEDLFEKSDKALTIEVREQLAQLQRTTDSSTFTRKRSANISGIAFFEFDPNTLSPEGWKKLGLRERAIQTIQKYLAHGGKFIRPEDLKKIYGFPKDLAAQLLPYVRIKGPEKKSSHDSRGARSNGKDEVYRFKTRQPVVVDINAADTAALIALPGIGSKLANRIISFREKLGGFYSVEQVKETYGLSDSTFQKIRSLLSVSSRSFATININTADYNMLARHPYIGKNIANAIVKYRGQHGNYGSVEDLIKIVVMTDEVFQKLKHYLSTD